MYIPHTINEKTITVILDNVPKTIASSHANFLKIKALLVSGKHDEIPSLIDIKTSIEKLGNGEIEIVGNSVRYLGRLVPDYQAQKLISLHRDGHANINPLKNFIVRLMANPSARAREEFARFADYKELPFDEQGFVYAYKGVDKDLWSISGNKETRVIKGKVNEQGKIFNEIGTDIEVERQDVDDNCNRHCSFGLHAGSFEYAKGFGTRTLLVKIDPADVVSVPSDCNGQKVRVCRYSVVSEYLDQKDITDSVITENHFEDNILEDDYDATDEDYYLAKFKDIVKQYNLTSKDNDLILFYMEEDGWDNHKITSNLIDEFAIYERIDSYFKKKNGHATWKQVQSALKSFQLKQSEIKSIFNKFNEPF